MTTAQREFEHPAAAMGAAPGGRRARRPNRGARLRLLLALAGLAALLAWGALSQLGSDPSAEGRSATSVEDAPRYDGRGKWTGYTSEWRSRPQILREAGITQDR